LKLLTVVASLRLVELVRSSRRFAAAALALLALGCGGGERLPPSASASASSQVASRHVQVVHAMTTPERRALVERFQSRNPGAKWIVNEEALASSLMVVDPFAGFLRRARRDLPPRAPHVPPVSAEEAATRARAFVERNADLLGLPRHVLVRLGEHVRSVAPTDHASPNAVHVVRFDASFESKGYEIFHEVDNLADVEVFVDDDGEVSSFVNRSRVHPRLSIDKRPALAQEDPRVTAQVVGREVFVLLDDAVSLSDRPKPRDVRELRRIPLGPIRAEEVAGVRLVIHESTGPRLAWLVYRLAWLVEVRKPAPPEVSGGVLGGSSYVAFRYVVDADTGDVVEDARAPVLPPATMPIPTL